MKKLIVFLFVAASLAACNNAENASETVVSDSTAVVSDSAAKTIDCNVDSVLAKDSASIK